jgi:hypothetical protein
MNKGMVESLMETFLAKFVINNHTQELGFFAPDNHNSKRTHFGSQGENS